MSSITPRVGLLLIVAGLVGALVNPRTITAQSVFSQEDREGLRIDADSMRHRSLGFALPTPSKNLLPSPLLEQQMAGMFGGQLPPDLAYWAFQDTTQHWAFIIQAVGIPGLDQDKFIEYSRGIRNGLSKRITSVSDTTIWDGTRRESRFVGRNQQGVYLGTRCVPSMKPRREYILCIQTFSAEPTTLAKVGGGLTVY